MKVLTLFVLLSLYGVAEDYKASWSLPQKASYYNTDIFNEHLDIFHDASTFDGNDINGYDMLRFSIATSDFNSSIYFLTHGCDLNKYDSVGFTPLMNAIKYKQYNIISYLLKKGATRELKSQTGQSLSSLVRSSKDPKIKALLPLKDEQNFSFDIQTDTAMKILVYANKIDIYLTDSLIKHFAFVKNSQHSIIVLDFHTFRFIKHQSHKIDSDFLSEIRLGWDYDYFRLALELKNKMTYTMIKEKGKISLTLNETE